MKEGEPVVADRPRAEVKETVVAVPPVPEIAPIVETLPPEQPELIQTTTVTVSNPVPTESSFQTHTHTPFVDIAVEVSEKQVVAEPPLFDEEVPFVPAATPVMDVPEIQEPVNVDSKRVDANVKTTRGSLFDLVPGLLGKSVRPAVKQPSGKDKSIPTIMDDRFELPSFLRK